MGQPLYVLETGKQKSHENQGWFCRCGNGAGRTVLCLVPTCWLAVSWVDTRCWGIGVSSCSWQALQGGEGLGTGGLAQGSVSPTWGHPRDQCQPVGSTAGSLQSGSCPSRLWPFLSLFPSHCSAGLREGMVWGWPGPRL